MAITLSSKLWLNYINRLSAIERTAGDKMRALFNMGGLPQDYEASKQVIDYANSLVMKYGEASAALTAEMYDAISLLENANVPPAVPAELPSYGEVAKAVNGTLKTGNAEIVVGAVERLVKMPGADTMLQNAKRDNAEWAWIPNGDTCAFCITLASQGWQPASKAILQGGHAEHIHGHCDCTFAIRHDSSTSVAGYDPEKYREIYDNAEGKSSKDKINSMRRELYAKNKEIVGTISDKAEEFIPFNKYGESIEFNRKMSDNPRIVEKRKEQDNLIRNLSSEYDTRLKEVKGGAERAAGDVDMTGQIMRLNSSNAGDALHEFAHTLANTKADKYGLTEDRDFWSEIRKIRTEYRKAVRANRDKMITVYADSDNILDEFMAEAFTHAKAKELKIVLSDSYGKDYTYSDQVLNVINKYFKKRKLGG